MKAKIIGTDTPLFGKIRINGSKNSALPILAASILTTDEIQLTNIPNIEDISYMIKLIESLNAQINFRLNQITPFSNHSITINCEGVTPNNYPCVKISNKLRASILLLGPLLARFGKAAIGLPGGCNIGTRGIDLHLAGLEAMGAKIIVNEADGIIEACVTNSSGKLHGKKITLSSPSVGATENILMAATLAIGNTIIKNASIEPEVVDLTKFLIKLGARITGIGTRKLIIHSVTKLHGLNINEPYGIIPDRIEAATYATYAIATSGAIELVGLQKKHLGSYLISKLVQVGGKLTFIKNSSCNSIIVTRKPSVCIKPITISTNPYPKFPTDLQPLFTSLLCLTKSTSSSDQFMPSSIIKENIFENRFQHVQELRKMGADIEFLVRQRQQPQRIINNNNIEIKKVAKLCSNIENEESSNAIMIYGSINRFNGCIVKATDLRGAAALVLAGLVAHGETIINDIGHLLRGYEAMDVKLRTCGANIELFS